MTGRSNVPLFRFNQEREGLTLDVAERVYRQYLTASERHDTRRLEYVLNEIAFLEIDRLRNTRGPETEIKSTRWWGTMARRLSELSETKKQNLLRELIDLYVEDTAGHFNPSVYRFTSGVLPIGLGFLLHTQSDSILPESVRHLTTHLSQLRDLSRHVTIEGPLEKLRRLSRKGTLLIVPTHSSNLDSIIIGWALEHAGLPPVTYGAGKNLFTNPLTSFFMKNLGAYRIDRRIGHALYKDVLKSYSQVLLERGYHSLFFPGGTRCRSNHVESRLKLGLLGTAISAFTRQVEAGNPRQIYVCPLTLNYHLVLEAESLIRDHLKKEGRQRYFLEDDPFEQVGTVMRYVANTARMSAPTVLRFGEPLDAFGNSVDENGSSISPLGDPIDPSSFVLSVRSGIVAQSAQRDRAYTRYTGQRIAESFRSNSILQACHLVAYTLFEILHSRFANLDVYALLRVAQEESVEQKLLLSELDRRRQELHALAEQNHFRLSTTIRERTLVEIMNLGLDDLSRFHTPPAVARDGLEVVLSRLDLLYFYSNRIRSLVKKPFA